MTKRTGKESEKLVRAVKCDKTPVVEKEPSGSLKDVTNSRVKTKPTATSNGILSEVINFSIDHPYFFS